MSYQTMNTEWCVAKEGTLQTTPIDDDYHDEADSGTAAHRASTTRTLYRRSWSKWFLTKTERDAVKAFQEAHKTVEYFYYTDPSDSSVTLVRFTTGFSEKVIGPYSIWEIDFSVEDV